MKGIFAVFILAFAMLASWNCGGAGNSGVNRIGVVLTNPGSIRRIDLVTGETIGSPIALSGNLRNIAFRQSNGQLYAIGTDNHLYRVNVINGICTQVSASPMAISSYNGGFTFLPGTTRNFAFINQNSDVYTINSDDGTATQMTDSNMPAFGLAMANGTTYIYTTDDEIWSSTNFPLVSNGFTLLGAAGQNLSGGLGMAIDPESGDGFVVSSEGVFRFNLSTGAVTLLDATAGDDIAIPE